MSSMSHDAGTSNQNLGNSLGSRPLIRQSKYFRQYESGNATKSLLGQGNLVWNTDESEGVFRGSKTFDAEASNHYPQAPPSPSASPPQSSALAPLPLHSAPPASRPRPAASSVAQQQPPLEDVLAARTKRLPTSASESALRRTVAAAAGTGASGRMTTPLEEARARRREEERRLATEATEAAERSDKRTMGTLPIINTGPLTADAFIPQTNSRHTYSNKAAAARWSTSNSMYGKF